MPTYEYACNACGEHLDAVQSFSDEPLTTCPNCGGELRKVFGAIGIVLKGSGFYKNDSRTSGKPRAGNGKDGKADAAKADGAGTSSDTKSGDGASSGSSSSESKPPKESKSDAKAGSAPKAASTS